MSGVRQALGIEVRPQVRAHRIQRDAFEDLENEEEEFDDAAFDCLDPDDIELQEGATAGDEADAETLGEREEEEDQEEVVPAQPKGRWYSA